MAYPDSRYVESGEATRVAHALLGGHSVTIPGAVILILLMPAVGFLFIAPRISGILFAVMLIGVIGCINRFNLACKSLQADCPDCGRLLEREEHLHQEYVVCHACLTYGRGRAFD